MSVIYSVINIFVIGGDRLSILLTDTLPIPLSIITTLISFRLWKKFAQKSSGAGMWHWFTLGWGMWALGEILYVIYAAGSEEVPYPCWADAAYVVGYIFLVSALVSRVTETSVKIKFHSGLLLWLISALIVTLAIIFVITPLIKNHETGEFIVNVLDVLYPSLDLVMLLLTARLIFDFLTRGSTTGWVLLIIGFLLMTFADLMYSYTNSFGLYYPDGQVNLTTTLGFALPYNLAYVFWILGIYRLQIRQEYDIPLPKLNLPRLVENTHILFFLKKDYSIDSVSLNFARVFTEFQPVGSDFFNLLRIRKTEKQEIIYKLSSEGKFADIELLVNTRRNDNILVKACGVSSTDPKRNFDGIVIVLRLVAGSNDMDSYLSDYQLTISRHVRMKSGSMEEAEICNFLLDYYHPLFRHLEALVHKFGGTQQGVVFMEYLNQVAERKGWDVRIGAKELTSGNFNEPFRLLKDTSALMSVGREYLGRIADVNEIDMELERVKSLYGVPVNQNYRYIKAVYRQQAENPQDT